MTENERKDMLHFEDCKRVLDEANKCINRKPRPAPWNNPSDWLDALEQLCHYVTNSPQRHISRNPYRVVPAVEYALRVVADARGQSDYLLALRGTKDRYSEKLP